ncbi:MAG: hypothetical protein JNJ83_11080 [Verrucomicrobiaceae bacterium]|nr:hypothetical protein [Verrucomicrobiaceae bacterium]
MSADLSDGSSRLPLAMQEGLRRLEKQVGDLSAELHGARDGMQRIVSAETKGRALGEVECVRKLHQQMQGQIIGMRAQINALLAVMAAAKMTGQVELAQPMPLETWRDDRAQDANQRELMLGSLHRSGDHTLDEEDKG